MESKEISESTTLTHVSIPGWTRLENTLPTQSSQTSSTPTKEPKSSPHETEVQIFFPALVLSPPSLFPSTPTKAKPEPTTIKDSLWKMVGSIGNKLGNILNFSSSPESPLLTLTKSVQYQALQREPNPTILKIMITKTQFKGQTVTAVAFVFNSADNKSTFAHNLPGGYGDWFLRKLTQLPLIHQLDRGINEEPQCLIIATGAMQEIFFNNLFNEFAKFKLLQSPQIEAIRQLSGCLKTKEYLDPSTITHCEPSKQLEIILNMYLVEPNSHLTLKPGQTLSLMELIASLPKDSLIRIYTQKKKRFFDKANIDINHYNLDIEFIIQFFLKKTIKYITSVNMPTEQQFQLLDPKMRTEPLYAVVESLVNHAHKNFGYLLSVVQNRNRYSEPAFQKDVDTLEVACGYDPTSKDPNRRLLKPDLKINQHNFVPMFLIAMLEKYRLYRELVQEENQNIPTKNELESESVIDPSNTTEDIKISTEQTGIPGWTLEKPVHKPITGLDSLGRDRVFVDDKNSIKPSTLTLENYLCYTFAPNEITAKHNRMLQGIIFARLTSTRSRRGVGDHPERTEKSIYLILHLKSREIDDILPRAYRGLMSTDFTGILDSAAVGFPVEKLSICKHLLNFLVKCQYISSIEAASIYSIAKKLRTRSFYERIVYYHFNTQHYENALRVAHSMHQDALKVLKQCKKISDFTESYAENADMGFRLGYALSLLAASPANDSNTKQTRYTELAIQAFALVGKGSPLYIQAKRHIAQLVKHRTSTDDPRDIQKQVLQHHIEAILKGGTSTLELHEYEISAQEIFNDLSTYAAFQFEMSNERFNIRKTLKILLGKIKTILPQTHGVDSEDNYLDWMILNLLRCSYEAVNDLDLTTVLTKLNQYCGFSSANPTEHWLGDFESLEQVRAKLKEPTWLLLTIADKHYRLQLTKTFIPETKANSDLAANLAAAQEQWSQPALNVSNTSTDLVFTETENHEFVVVNKTGPDVKSHTSPKRK